MHLGEVLEHQAEIDRLGGRVLAVSFTPPAKAAAYLRHYPLPCDVVTDPDMTAYRLLGLGRTSWLSILSPRSLFDYTKMLFRGGKVQKPLDEEDFLQLGGDFVLDPQRRLLYAYRSATATDRPAVADLLHALRTSGSAAVP
ncbi:MAG: AhpC/TSA family protein [Gemmataceae bacterium]